MLQELLPEYLNKIANQLLVINSLLGGFSITVMANLLVNKTESKLLNAMLKVTVVAVASFLVSVFAMTKIMMMTTLGYPSEVANEDLLMPKVLGFSTFFVGITALSLLIALAGWTKSKQMGIFTSIIGGIAFLMILMNL